MQMLFKFQDNWIKIEDCRNLAYVVILVYVDLLADGDLKTNRWLNSVALSANALKISSQSDENWGF